MAAGSEEEWPSSKATGCARGVKGGWEIGTLKSAR